MIIRILKTAYRNLSKYKINTIINIGALAVGFSAYILINLYVNYEKSWDKYHANYERIYRVQQIIDNKGDIWTQTPAAVPDALKQTVPEIEHVTLYREAWGQYLSNDSVQINDLEGVFVDSSFFNIFTIKFLEGSAHQFCNDSNSIYLDKSLSDKLFPNKNAFGKTVLIDKKYIFRVAGVYDSIPTNNTIKPSYLLPFKAMVKIKEWKNYRSDWNSSSYRTYLTLKPNANANVVNSKIKNLYKTFNIERDFTFYLLPASNFYLNPSNRNDYTIVLQTYSLIAIFLLILVSINYINFTLANASSRLKELAIRKVNGCSNSVLFSQFLTESLITVLISIIIGLLTTDLLLPFFNTLIDRNLALVFPESLKFYTTIVPIMIGVGIFSGIYPAYFMASANCYQLLHGVMFSVSRSTLRKILVTFQYSISLFLIITSIIVAQQLWYLLHKDLGFDCNNILFTTFITKSEKQSFEKFKADISDNQVILNGCFSYNIPFYWSDGKVVSWEGGNPANKVDIRVNNVSYDFLSVMGIQIIKGRGFSKNYPGDTLQSCIINETAAATFGWENPIGKTIDNGKLKVIGVVKDFHPYSVHEKIPLYLFTLRKDFLNPSGVYSFKIAPGKLNDAKKLLTDKFAKNFPNDPFEFKLLSDVVKNEGTYKTYRIIRNTIFFFTVLTLVLTIFGLLGLVSFTINRKIKEIGIRKINGSSVWEIYFLLNKEFLLLIVIAAPIAIVGSVFIYEFLPFNYRYGLHAGIFIWSILLIIFVSVIATIFYTLKAAFRNPAELIRYE